MHGHSGTVFDIKRDADGKVYTISTDGVIAKWDPSRTRQMYRIAMGAPAVAFSLSNGMVVVGTSRAVSMYDSETKERVRSVIEGVESVYCLETTETHIFVGYRAKGEARIASFSYSALGVSLCS